MKQGTNDGVVLQFKPIRIPKVWTENSRGPHTEQVSYTTCTMRGSQPHPRQKIDNAGKGADNRAVAPVSDGQLELLMQLRVRGFPGVKPVGISWKRLL